MSALAEPPTKPTQSPPAAPEQQIKVVIPNPKGKAPPAAPKQDDPPPQKVAPPAAGAEDEPEIPTNIMPVKEKTASQYRDERLKGKEQRVAEKLGVPEMEAELTSLREYKTKASTYEADLARERQERQAEQARIAELTARQEELARQAKEAETRYFDDFKVNYDPSSDDELRTAHQSMRSSLAAKMPVTVPTADGKDQRVFFGKLMENPENERRVNAAMDFYAKAEELGDPVAMDRAVNLMLMVAGAPVKFSQRPDEEVLVDSAHPAFVKAEEAMREALPSFQKRSQREQYVTEQAPQLVMQAIRGREDSIKGSLRTAIFLDSDTRASLAAINPLDSGVIIGDVLETNPQLAESLNSYIAVSAPALARMGKIQMPTLTSSDPAAITAHRQEAQRHQAHLGEMMRKAAIGHVAGPIIMSMMGELNALRERFGHISENENPGGTRPGESGNGTADEPEIPTQILPVKRK